MARQCALTSVVFGSLFLMRQVPWPDKECFWADHSWEVDDALDPKSPMRLSVVAHG